MPVTLDVLAAARRQLSSAKPIVLVVDDDEGIRRMLELALRDFECQARLACCGTEALEVCAREVVDLVLLDVSMPGMDGVETLAGLRAISPDVRCCFMTAGGSKYTIADLLKSGACRVLEKPFRLAEVKQCLKDLVGRT